MGWDKFQFTILNWRPIENLWEVLTQAMSCKIVRVILPHCAGLSGAHLPTTEGETLYNLVKQDTITNIKST